MMIKQLQIIGIALLTTAFCSSCSKDVTGGPDHAEGESGKMTITFGFDNGGGARAQSTAKPTTSWKGNIKDLLILFVKADGTVADARNIDVPQAMDMANKEFSFTNLVANPAGQSYTVYLVANSQQAAAITAKGGWTASNCRGKNISNMLMQLVVNSAFTPSAGGTETGSTAYLEPAEIFLASKSGIVIKADANTDLKADPFVLTRAISLLRVRIDQSKNGNALVDFLQADASFRVRRASNDLKIDGTYTRGNEKSLIYTKGAFKNANPGAPDGYNAGGTIVDANFTLWKDIKMLPGGSKNTGSQKFDVVLIGKAPTGYVPLGKTEAEKLAAPADVAWAGAVNEIVDANGILEINLTLESAGKWVNDPSDPGVPKPNQYGSIVITTSLAPWGSIKSTDIPL